MRTIDIFLQSLLALFAFFWLSILITSFPYPANVILFADVTLVFIILDLLMEKKMKGGMIGR